MNAARELQELLKLRLVRLAALTLLLAAAGARAMQTMYCVLDPDVWWHLRTGDWILQTHSVPHTGLFSRTAAAQPWIAYSWGYETLLSKIYALSGLMGIGLFGVFLTIAVTAALFWSLLKVSEKFWLAWLLTVVAASAFLFSIMPRPVFVSMLLFALLLALLLEAQRCAELRPLYWLPLLFVVWANFHIQFIYGLFALGLFAAVHLFQSLLPPDSGISLTPKPLRPLPLLAVFAACFAASCVGPYSFHLFQVVLEYSKAKVTYSIIIELLPLDFSTPSQFIELFLAAAACFALGWRRKFDLFKLALLATAAILAFRTARDAWFLCIVSAVLIAASCHGDEERATAHPGWGLRLQETTGVALAVALCLFLIARNTDFTTRGLDKAVSGFYPVNAANFLRANPLPGPIFNSFDWGGFLIWYMPQYPVSIDGRNDLYGDQLDHRLYGVESGELNYAAEPHFNESRLIVLRLPAPLAESLAADPAYRAVYRDNTAVIYVPQ